MPKNTVNTSKKCKQVGFGGGVPRGAIYIYIVFFEMRYMKSQKSQKCTWLGGLGIAFVLRELEVFQNSRGLIWIMTKRIDRWCKLLLTVAVCLFHSIQVFVPYVFLKPHNENNGYFKMLVILFQEPPRNQVAEYLPERSVLSYIDRNVGVCFALLQRLGITRLVGFFRQGCFWCCL